MLKLQTILLTLIAALVVCGCGVVPRSPQPPVQAINVDTTSSTEEVEEQENPLPPARMVSSLDEVKASLMQAYRDWKGTPYQIGGQSKEGVDCSLLVNAIFDNYFGIDLPTNTRTQLNAGDGIRRSAIRTGDLVFFRTGRQTLHVGIAVNGGEFLHASTSNGVMISKLGNSYWRNRFLAARRVF